MTRGSDREIQEFLDRLRRQGAELPRGEREEEPADFAAYRVVYEALSEDPGFTLPPSFAEAVATRAARWREKFSWYENVIVPALLASGVAYLLASFGRALIEELRQAISAAASLGSALGGTRVDVLLAGTVILLLLALGDRVVGRSIARHSL